MIAPTLISLITASALLLPASRASAEEFPFKPLAEAPACADETFFKVADGEAKVDGEVIQLFVVKPEHLTVSYRNGTGKALFPKYVVKLYNRYGILIGSESVNVSLFGGSTKLEPGDVGGEKIRTDLVDLELIFRHTGCDLPVDFDEAAWLSLSDSNTRVTMKEPDEATE